MTDWEGAATFVGAFLGPVALMVIAWLNHRGNVRIEAGMQAVKEDVQQVQQIASETGVAVNGRSHQEPTVSEDIAAIRAKQEHDVPTLRAGMAPDAPAVLPLLRWMAIAVEELTEKVDRLTATDTPRTRRTGEKT